MKAVILAGGKGSRLAEETQVRPKPMVAIGGQPILWHIMKIYSCHGINEFVICLGYKGYMIKEYFANYFLHKSNVTFDMRENRMIVHEQYAEPWRVTLVDTGADTMSGGRLKAVRPWLEEEDFCMTYGDGLADVDVTATVAFHRNSGRLATVTAVQAPGRFGRLKLDGDRVQRFNEKPRGEGGWINGGFFVLAPAALDYVDSAQTVWEREPLRRLTDAGELMARKHLGFWQPMDTLREKEYLEQLWATSQAPWKVWEDPQLKLFGGLDDAEIRRAA